MGSRLLVVAFALAGVAGCGGHSGEAPAPAASAAPGSAAPSPSPSTPAGLHAADGTDLSACRDGRCEVVVSVNDKISPLTRFGLKALTVKEITPDGVTYVGTGPGIMVSAGSQRPGTTSHLNGLAITTVAISGYKAVMRLAPQ